MSFLSKTEIGTAPETERVLFLVFLQVSGGFPVRRTGIFETALRLAGV